ncbi:MAG: hypothetical protein ABI647_10725 [Gemmatimonadota bacterium]
MQYTSQIEKLQRLWLANPHGTTFAPLAEAYRKAGMFEDALGALEIGLSRHPKYFPGHIVLGRCYLDLKDEVKAEEAFVDVLELDAENVIALKALADLAELHGERDLATERLRRLLDLDPANEDALAQLARVAVEPVIVVTPVEPAAEPEPSEDETLGGQGEVIDPAAVDFDVQLFQPIELLPLDASEFQVPNDAESLRARESGAFAWTEPAVPVHEEPVSSSIPAEPPVEPVATLDDIRWASDGLDLRPHGEVAEREPEALVAEIAPPAGDDCTAEIVIDAAIPAAHAPSVEPDSVSVAVVDLPPRRLTLEPTLVQLPVIPPLPPVRPAAVREDLTTEAGAPAPDLPVMTEAAAAAADPEPAVPTSDAVPATAFPEWEPTAEPASPAAPVQVWATDPDAPAGPERLTVSHEPVSAVDAPMPPSAFAEPSAMVGEAPETAASEEPAVPAEPAPTAEVEQRTADAAAEASELLAPAADVPTMAGILAGSTPAEPVVEEDAPGESEPELVVTETMAEIFLRQGYTELALAVYSQLATRDPGNPRIEAAKSRLMTKTTPSVPSPASEPTVRRLAVAATGGRPATAWLAQVFAVGPPGAGHPVHPPAFEAAPAAEPTRPSTDTLSLSSVFGGDETVPPPPADSSQPIAEAAQPGEEAGPSFDEFFGTPAEPAPIAGDAPSGSGQPIEDLEQFNAWLKGLKR